MKFRLNRLHIQTPSNGLRRPLQIISLKLLNSLNPFGGPSHEAFSTAGGAIDLSFLSNKEAIGLFPTTTTASN
jgi:hypothetical protein